MYQSIKILVKLKIIAIMLVTVTVERMAVARERNWKIKLGQ